MTRGVVYIAYGEAARRECMYSVQSLRKFHSGIHIRVACDEPYGLPDVEVWTVPLTFATAFQMSRILKTRLNYAGWDSTLYLDADTRVNSTDILAGFDILESGFDLVIVPSQNQGDDLFWHVDPVERLVTLEEIGYPPLQLQGGVFWFAQNERVDAFFHTWNEEWHRWKGQDQAALVRALHRSPLKVWLIGRAFNGGAVVSHYYGRAKER